MQNAGPDDKFNEYYEDLNSKILRNFRSEMDKTKNILFRVIPSSKGINNIKKMEMEKEQDNLIHFRQIAVQDRLQKHLVMNKKSLTRRIIHPS